MYIKDKVFLCLIRLLTASEAFLKGYYEGYYKMLPK